MRSGNPSLNDESFKKFDGAVAGKQMTIQGTVNKTLILMLLLLATSVYSWNQFLSNPNSAMPLILVGAIGGLIVALITIFVPKVSPFTAPLYALLEGLFLGAVSAQYEVQYGGIVFQAVLLTIGVLLSLLLAYKSGFIKVTQNFRMGVVAATGAIFIVYLISFIGSFFGFQIPYLHESSPIGIAISVVIVIIAALNLVLDFDFIENASERRVPKYFEWYGAFGLLVTLVWLYLEILRLLSKLRNR
ncbi:Bax inhibitor-1/YccA family protein [Planococcus shenhongbingii]|uniref:Bax inhibitor-1/YccA family protein n=1 Tax=Planococcus shenhongbingii TaxID=3058398 RepID=A0ABT8N7R4_9BACL|nr:MULTISPECIES: Bax inhibitor-1/YccA family protein [unclassified Planococcus (in: firmicutes)]MDN7243915.1 Bax inhibitor-1/YccA family protein [Planococcus sp. N017]WKA57094.1 Bax inhibitor-1/YccA family protein [Planococcus sp. N016]